jgi:Tol biopolymer transport system component
LVYKGTGSVTLHDLADDGSALITYDKTQIKIAARGAGDVEERDLTFHDWSLVRDISPDGSSILFTEAGESGGALYAAYIREMNGSQTKKLGEGSALALSPNGRFALVKLGTSPARLAVYEIATGERRFLETMPKKSFIFQPWACWFPDGKKILFAANEAESGTRLYVQEIDAGVPICLTPEAEGFEISTPHAISPNGASVLVIHPNRRIYLLSAASGKLTALPDLEPDHLGVGWSADGEKIFMRERGQVPAIIFSYDLKTGKRETVLKLIPHYRTGVHEILRVLLTPDRSAYAYSYTREFSDLMIIEGLA